MEIEITTKTAFAVLGIEGRARPMKAPNGSNRCGIPRALEWTKSALSSLEAPGDS